MADAPRSLEDIKKSMQHNSADLNAVKQAIADLCDHLTAERNRVANEAAKGTPIVRTPDGKVFL